MPDYDFYKVLNVPRDASADEIKKAYKKEVLHARQAGTNNRLSCDSRPPGLLANQLDNICEEPCHLTVDCHVK